MRSIKIGFSDWTSSAMGSPYPPGLIHLSDTDRVLYGLTSEYSCRRKISWRPVHRSLFRRKETRADEVILNHEFGEDAPRAACSEVAVTTYYEASRLRVERKLQDHLSVWSRELDRDFSEKEWGASSISVNGRDHLGRFLGPGGSRNHQRWLGCVQLPDCIIAIICDDFPFQKLFLSTVDIRSYLLASFR